MSDISIKQMLEKLKRIIVEPSKKVFYDDMEDETGLNVVECMSFSQIGEAPTPVLTKKKKKDVTNESLDYVEKEVTPIEMLSEVEESFDPYEILTSVVKNKREIIKVSVKYTDPTLPALMYEIKCEFLDIDEETVIDETVDTELTTKRALEELEFIFSTHYSIDEVNEEFKTHPRFIPNYDYSKKDFEIGQRVDTIEGNGKIKEINTVGDNYYYIVDLDNGDRLSAYGWELLPESFDNVSKKLFSMLKETEASDKEKILSLVATWIEKLNFKNVKTDRGFKYLYEGNYQHFIYFNNNNLILRYRIYENESTILYDHSWYINTEESVNNAFNVISKTLDSYE